MNLDKQFRKVVNFPFSSFSVEDLKPIVLGFWHESYTPELSNLNLEQQRFKGHNKEPI